MGHILVVEHEPDIRSVLLAAFERDHHTTDTAGPCVKAKATHDCDLSCCTPDREPNVAVIAAISPRQCSGIETALKALARWPRVKILLISATPPDLWPESARQCLKSLPERSYAFLAKPFTIQQLRTVVQNLIG